MEVATPTPTTLISSTTVQFATAAAFVTSTSSFTTSSTSSRSSYRDGGLQGYNYGGDADFPVYCPYPSSFNIGPGDTFGCCLSGVCDSPLSCPCTSNRIATACATVLRVTGAADTHTLTSMTCQYLDFPLTLFATPTPAFPTYNYGIYDDDDSTSYSSPSVRRRGVSTTGIIGIVIGIFSVVIGLIGFLVRYRKRKEQQRLEAAQAQQTHTMGQPELVQYPAADGSHPPPPEYPAGAKVDSTQVQTHAVPVAARDVQQASGPGPGPHVGVVSSEKL